MVTVFFIDVDAVRHEMFRLDTSANDWITSCRKRERISSSALFNIQISLLVDVFIRSLHLLLSFLLT